MMGLSGEPVPAKKQFIIISYDISNDRNRLKVMKALEDYGTRVQYSVFECILRPKELDALKRRVQPYIQRTDSVRFYFLNAGDVARIQVLGSGAITREAQFFLY